MYPRKYLSYEFQHDLLDRFSGREDSPKTTSVPTPENDINLKYNEAEILVELEEYIKSTYNQHYIGKSGVQVNDLIIALGHAEGSYISNAIEYLARYGKKGGKNRKDLLKAIHNIMLLISNDFYGESENE
jgi:hypothetical protein